MALSNLTKVQTIGIGSNIEVVGVVTTGQFKSGTSNLHSTGVELTNLNVSGIATIGGNLSIGGTLTYEDVTNIDSIGIITARSGIHIDDSIVHIGDTNTKIRFPAADTITAETGGSERLRITSAGKIGVNYAGNPPAETMMISSGDSTTGLSLSHLSGGNRYGFRLSTIGGTNKGLIISPFFNAGYTEALRINSNGDVTTTGQASFSRQNAGFTARAGDAVSITRASGTPLEINRTGSDGQMISLLDDNTQEASISISSGSLEIGVPNSSNPRVIIDTSGRLGIQGAPTRALLDVRASGGSNTMLTALFGANEGQTGGTLSDNADKGARVGLYHYDTDALPYALFTSGSTSSANSINFGGGTSLMNAATSLGLYTAANTTTANGTRRLYISSGGQVSISKNGWTGSDMTFGLTVHTGDTSDSGNPVNDGIMIVSQNSGGNQNSTTGKLMFCGHAQTNGPFLYGDNEQAYGKKGLVFHTRSTANSYSTQLEETARFTHSGNFGLGTGTAVDSLMHISGNSDDGGEACQLTIEDEDTSAGSRVPSIQFKGNGTNTYKIRGTDLSGLQLQQWNGSSQIDRAIVGNPDEAGAFLLNADDRGWATFRHNHNQGLRTHIRQRYAPGNAVSTYTILRIRRHWWGWGSYKIRCKALYYNSSLESTYYVNGHGSGGNSYSISQETFGGDASSNNWNCTVTHTASNNAPGSSSTWYADVKVNIPNYYYAIIYIEAYSSGYSTDPNNIGADSYCLM